MKANSDKSKQSNKATRRVLAGVLCGASVLSLVLSLVMPPISQAIANDAQTVSAEETVTEDSSSESAGVDNAADEDTENQISDDGEGGETGSSNGDEQAQPEGKLQAEDGELSDGNAVMPEGGQTETTSTEIRTADELKNLANVSGAASFKLMNDIETSGTIQLNNSVSNITLDLNGCKIKHKSPNQPLFNITGGATLTVKDGQQAAATEITANQENKCGNLASMEYGDSNIPTKLTYYVTESVASGTVTNETLKAYEAGIKGAIVACSDTKATGLKLVNLFNGGHFNLESGVLTQKKDGQIGNLIYAEGGSTVNMSGGYVCGASGSGAGAGIMVSNESGGASTLNLTGGVIAGNSAYSGGGVYAKASTVTITNGVISGNSTLESVGFGGGIMAEYGGKVTVSGGYITNNKYAKFCGKNGDGCHGGAGLAARNGTHVTISGGQITGNYSEEAGGGVYVTDVDRQGWSRKDTAWLRITGGTIASNVSFRSEGAGIRVGQMVDAMINGTSNTNPVYITNNHCMSRFDWGGGGIFVQGDSNTASNAGRLFVYNSYISSNEAGGYGGGVAVCPTGKTLVTNTDGTAIFGNTSAGSEENYKSYDDGNDGIPHLSGGGHGKNQDFKAYSSAAFRDNGHTDFFLAAEGHSKPIAAVIGKMLGGGDAQYKGSKELKDAITIPANGGVQVYNSIGLSSGVQAGDPAATTAQSKATTFITGNYSWNHGGGIMSNGDLYLGQPADMYVYPSLKLKATKALIKLINSQTKEQMDLAENQFTFKVYRKNSSDPLTSTTFNRDVCTEVGTAKNDANGNITFDLGEQFATGGAGDQITYYLVEDSGNDSGITYDSNVYEIVVTAKDNSTVLMTVPKKDNPNEQIQLNIHNYTIDNVSVTKREFDKLSGKWNNVKAWNNVRQDEGYYPIACDDGLATFTNKYTPYTSSGSWTPKATKVVEGGEMKKFTLWFADNDKFDNAKTVTTDPDGEIVTTADGDKSQPLSFVDKITYTLADLAKGTDPTGRGASKTFTYYVREKDNSSLFSHYKFDKSVYKITVKATDQSDKTIKCEVTYAKIVDADGIEIPANKQIPYEYGEDSNVGQSLPTFTNTYSTSLPLSGMSGVTLTYLAGAAVLCAAAAWMHIRRKANAKGGERRE